MLTRYEVILRLGSDAEVTVKVFADNQWDAVPEALNLVKKPAHYKVKEVKEAKDETRMFYSAKKEAEETILQTIVNLENSGSLRDHWDTLNSWQKDIYRKILCGLIYSGEIDNHEYFRH